MAGEKKKRRGRSAYLNDFHLNEQGDYVYKGKLFGFIEKTVTYQQYLFRIGLAAVSIFLLTVTAECLPAVAMSRFGLTSIPWLGQMIAACFMAYAVWKIFWGKNPMREYIYKASVQKLPMRALFTAVFSFLTALAEAIYILVNGCDGEAAFTVLRPILSMLCGMIAICLYRFVKNTEWKQITNMEC